MPLFGDAYLADTRHLSLEEHGAYLQLMMIAWRSSDCVLPDDDTRLARMLGITAGRWAKLKSTVMAFWTLTEKGWAQKRLSKERAFVDEKRAKNKSAADARWNGQVAENKQTDECERTSERNAPPPPPPEVVSEAKASSTQSARVEKFPRPDFADPDDWSDFLGNRKKKHLNNSGSAHAKLLRDVAHWSRETGWPPGTVFRACVENGWAGIYDPRTGNNGRGNQNFGGHRDKRDGVARALDRSLGYDPPDGYSTGGTGEGGGSPVARLAALR
jgi:uncharacterized protein YdaU (DUF1376 family)